MFFLHLFKNFKLDIVSKIKIRKKFAMPFYSGGFTLLEMIVVIGIMVLVATLILVNPSRINENLAIQRAAEEIASSGRQAQAYGLGVKEFRTGSGIFPGYGLYFDKSVPNSYIFFADRYNNLQYDSSPAVPSDEKVSEVFIQGNAYIVDLCANQKQMPAGPCGLNNLNVVYLRPQPQVSLKTNDSFYNDFEVKIKGPRGTVKTIIFWQSGQISIE